jgi:glycosyltransferase involved in cell wall biosynthesis
LAYPAYPFFWQHKVTPYYWMSRAFARRVKRLVNRGGGRVIVDVMDLPRIQYRDLGLPMEMSLRAFERFDQDVFSNADELWVCSGHLAEYIQENHGCAVRTVLNGTVPRQTQSQTASGNGIVRFLYAGSMNPARGIGPVIESFRRLPHPNARLRLCGTDGEWLREAVADDPRIEYLGSLTDAQAAEVAADCDVGLIPYPETGYYQIAFATKLPFYLELGLPILVSRVAETGGHVERLGVGLVRPLSEWTEAFALFLNCPEKREAWAERLRAVAPEFYWETLYGRALEGVTPLLPSRQSLR